MEKVVVAVDFSASSMAAAHWTAAHLAGDAEIVVAHTLELPSVPNLLWEVLPPPEVLEPQVRRRSEEKLEELLEELGNANVRAEILSGHPGEEIAALAADENADLVVAGKHGSHHGVWHILGSTAEQLVAACHRPVLLARNLPPGPLENVLVPVDDSEVAARALGWAATVCQPDDAQLIAHHVVTEWYYHRVRELDTEEKAREIQDGVAERAKAWLTEFAADNAHGARTIEHVNTGQPGFQTLAAIESFNADLVVVGNHGLKSLIGDPLARLSRFLILAAPCSIFIVPDEVTELRSAA